MRHATLIAILLALIVAVAAGCVAAGARAGDAATLAGSRLVVWPTGAPVFGAVPGGGPSAMVVDLATGSRRVAHVPGIAPGDFPVALLPVDRSLVYNSDGGVAAIGDDLRGPRRLLGRAAFFVPDVGARVVLVDTTNGRPVRVRRVRVAGGRSSGLIRLPAGTAGVVEGTNVGLVLVSQTGRLELWRPGGRPRSLGRVGAAMEGGGVAADGRLIVYTSGCRLESATRGFPRVPVGFSACARLRIVDLATGTRLSVAAPAGTVGWVPGGFGSDDAIAPGDRLVAAEAAVAPAAQGKVRVFAIRLGRQPAVTAAPGSSARLYARTAWSSDGSWLLYQGRGEHLHAFQIATGATRNFPLDCCRYTAMAVTRTRR